jgi:hypothetical protein
VTTFGFDAERQHVQEEAGILMLKVALVLLAEARRRGDFGTEEELATRSAELTDELSGGMPSPDPRRPLIEAELLRADRIHLSAATREGSATVAGLGIDGILFDQGGFSSLTAVAIDRGQLSEEERADLDRRQAEWQKERERLSQFTASRFVRAIAAPPQPGAAMRVLALMLYEDGFYVEQTNEKEPPSLEDLESAESYFARDEKPEFQVEDDLGTEYFASGGGGWGGGIRVSRGSLGFAPAPPPSARLLRITSESGTVEFDLEP